MKIKKYLKQFFSLDRRASGGFTLVELIVVIAILAILAGVGVPAYSGYVTKANQQADITLASDIENALLLAYYDQKLESGASVIVYHGGQAADTVKADDGVTDYGAAAAMEAAFGSGWTSLSLAYNGWDNAAGSVVANYTGSSYEGTESALLGDVQNLTDAFETFIMSQNGDIEDYTGEEFTTFMANNNIDQSDPQQMANSLAMYVAYRSESAAEAEFIAAWKTPGNPIGAFDAVKVGENGKLGFVGSLAATYARGEALVKYVDAKVKAEGGSTVVTDTVTVDGVETTVTYNTLSEWFSAQDVNGPDSNAVKNKISDLNSKTEAKLMAVSSTHTLGYFDAQAEKDAKAYLAVLGAVNTSAPALKKNLNSENLYNDGTVETLLNSYIAAGKALAGAPANAMVVVFTETATGADVVAYPIDYVN